MKRRRPPPRSLRQRRKSGVGAPPLTVLDEFSEQSLSAWLRTADNLRSLHSALHFGLEEQRQQVGSALEAALQEAATGSFTIEGWSRIVDYRFSLSPLSVRGSLSGDGGRFNIGSELNAASFTPFPALYIGADYETAFSEKFGHPPTHCSGGLTPIDLALRKPGSFTHISLRGRVETVLDVMSAAALEPFIKVIRKFLVPFGAMQKARKFGSAAPGLIRSTDVLMAQLVDPDWARAPVQFDLPSNSQVFGRIAVAAGLHAILYPSARIEGKRCLALFPQNWEGSDCFIEISDGAPEGARAIRIDASTWAGD